MSKLPVTSLEQRNGHHHSWFFKTRKQDYSCFISSATDLDCAINCANEDLLVLKGFPHFPLSDFTGLKISLYSCCLFLIVFLSV